MASRSSGHDVSRAFGSDNGANNTPSTPTSSPAPSSNVTGLQYSGKLSRRWGGQNIAEENRGLENNRRLAENLERAYEGDDSALLPWPTNTSNAPRPRTVAAGYDRVNRVLFVRFRPGADRHTPGGAGYEYHNVTPAQWREFRSSPSPGRYINRVLNYHPYYPADW